MLSHLSIYNSPNLPLQMWLRPVVVLPPLFNNVAIMHTLTLYNISVYRGLESSSMLIIVACFRSIILYVNYFVE